MKTLIIHPTDPSTDFLKPIYRNIEKSTIVNGGIPKKELRHLVRKHDRILMMGHGSPQGLFAVNQFPGEGLMSYIIDDSFVTELHQKDNMYIWCHANQFVQRHQLSGFFSGMFISEVSEAIMYGIDAGEESIIESNNSFSEIVSEHAYRPSKEIYLEVYRNYAAFSENNPIAMFNNQRLQFV